MMIKMMTILSVIASMPQLTSPEANIGRTRFNIGANSGKDNVNGNDDDWMIRTRDLISRLSNSSGKTGVCLPKSLTGDTAQKSIKPSINRRQRRA
jgi:hypothetical protein